MDKPKITNQNGALKDFILALASAQLELEKKRIDAAVARDREHSTGELDFEP